MNKLFLQLAPLGALALGVAGCGGGTSRQSSIGPGNNSNTIVFVSTRDGNPEIYRMGADGSNQVRLTNNAAADTNPSINRAGTEVVFSSDRDGNAEIYKLTLADGTLLRLTNDDPTALITVADRAPIFSPDGSKIAWLTQRDQTGGADAPFVPFVMNSTGANQRRVSNLTARLISWGGESNRLAFVGTDTSSSLVFRQTIDGTGTTASELQVPADTQTFKVSPSGANFLYDRAVAAGDAARVLILTPETNTSTTANSVTLAPSGFSTDYQASLSPDGTRVAFAANRATGTTTTGFQIYRSSVASPDAAPVQLTTVGSNTEPAWAE